MRAANNSVETINAAATAIVAAEGRVQQTTVQKRRWGSWRRYWCFGSQRHGKRIGHAVLIPEPEMPGTAAPPMENPIHTSTIALPFVAPPSSPASFLQSEPPSVTQSPSGLLSLSLSANVYSPGGPASIFAIGPYAHETQLVSPPVFSTFTTEPSTAPFTPPPEPVHLTTPSSPEVPFAQLLTSSLDSNHRKSEAFRKFPISNYEFQSYQLYPGSPVGYLISPSSAISGSGTSSPYPDPDFISGGRPLLHFGRGDPPKLLSIDGFSTRQWGLGRGSGSLTPDAAGLISRGSGSLTPDAAGPTSRGSGSLTPDAAGPTSRGSRSLTPDAAGPTAQDSFLPESQMSEVASLANSDNGSQIDDIVVGHRVSFELAAEDVEAARCVEKVPVALIESVSETVPDTTAAATTERDGMSTEAANAFECRVGETLNDLPESASGNGEEQQQQQQQNLSSLLHGSMKEFMFDNADGAASDKQTVGSDWWANEKVVGKESRPRNDWAFFPMIQPGIS